MTQSEFAVVVVVIVVMFSVSVVSVFTVLAVLTEKQRRRDVDRWRELTKYSIDALQTCAGAASTMDELSTWIQSLVREMRKQRGES